MILGVKNIHKAFGGVKALDGCSFEIAQGKITALIGPNGSGKSTVFNVISRILKEDKGSVSLKKEDVTTTKDFIVARRGLSRTFQQVRLFRNLTIREHLEIALSTQDEKMVRSMFSSEKFTTEKLKEVLELVGLTKPLSTFATDLSYGQRKLLDLAIAIVKPHDVLMLDEPVAGVNPKLREEIKRIIIDLNKKGETIFVIEHDMNFVMDLADHIIVMDCGKIIAEGKPAQIQKNKKVLMAYLGE